MDRNRLVAYSLLAHINNNQAGIRDLTDIFVPLVKRALARMTSRGRVEGQLADVKQAVDDLYSLDIPFPFLKQMVLRIEKEHSRSEEAEFVVHKDGSFVSENFAFVELEEIALHQQAEIEAVQEAFVDFARTRGLDADEYPSVFEFIDRNRVELSSYFIDPSMETEAHGPLDDNLLEFLALVGKDPKFFSVFRKIYLGSVIAGYLTMGGERTQSPGFKLELVLDTNFLIGLLDFSTEASNHTCSKLVEIARRLGFRLTVLSITIEEAQGVFNRYAEQWGSRYFWEKSDPQSIYNACSRRRLTRTDLQVLAGRMENEIQSHDISIVYRSEKYLNMARLSPEYEKEKLREYNPDGALHDVSAIMYVREKRGHKVSEFMKSVAWFVTHPRGQLSLVNRPERGYLGEVIRADDLLCLLWLSSPEVKLADSIDTSLTQHIANAIADSFPSGRVLREFGENVARYARQRIQHEDIILVSNVVAHKSLKSVRALNKVAEDDPSAFLEELEEMARAAKDQEHREQRSNEERLEQVNREFEERLSEKEVLLKKQHELDLDDVRRKVAESTETRVREEMGEIYTRELTSTYLDLRGTKDHLDQAAERSARRTLWFIAVLGLVAWTGVAYAAFELDWNRLEPLIYVVLGFPIAYYVAVLLFFLLFSHEPSFRPRDIQTKLVEYFRRRNYKRSAFPLRRFEQLESQSLRLRGRDEPVDNSADAA